MKHFTVGTNLVMWGGLLLLAMYKQNLTATIVFFIPFLLNYVIGMYVVWED